MSNKPETRTSVGDEDPIRVTTKRKQRVVEVELEDGSIRRCVIKEMLGPELTKWTTIQTGRIVLEDKKLRQEAAESPHAVLISLCLYDATSGQSIPQSEIEGWPSTAQTVLFIECQKLSGLTEEGRESEKKQSKTGASKPRGT